MAWRGRLLLALLGAAPLGALIATAGAAPAGVHARTSVLYTLHDAPRASFVWFPTNPHPGEAITLISTSVDPTSPITAWGWDTSDDGPFGAFAPGGPSSTATFSTFADHVVRLRVAGADHLDGVTEETIHMSKPPPGVLFPFPEVRMLGRVRASGVKLTGLFVRAPAGSHISISCHARGCPVAFIAALARATPAGHPSWLRFRRMQRFLPAGVSLQLRISAPGEIGAYTRFTVRHRRLPVRVDSCLNPAGVTPIVCPS